MHQNIELYSLGTDPNDLYSLEINGFSRKTGFCMEVLDRFAWEFQNSVWTFWGDARDVGGRPVAVFLFSPEIC